MKYIAITLVLANVALIGFLVGQFNAPIEDQRLEGMSERLCDDIERRGGQLRCSFRISSEDANFVIYEGEGARDD